VKKGNSSTCYQYFLNLLNSKDYSEYELTQKGIKKKYLILDIQEAIQALQIKKFQSDARIVENYLYFYSKIRGFLWFLAKFQEKGISKELYMDLLTEQFDNSNIDYTELIDVIIKKYKLLNQINIDYKLKLKILNFIKSKGHTNNLKIYKQILTKIDNLNNQS
jgi:SOS response regulatory protein OraA/RecX